MSDMMCHFFSLCCSETFTAIKAWLFSEQTISDLSVIVQLGEFSSAGSTSNIGAGMFFSVRFVRTESSRTSLGYDEEYKLH